ncbi:MAG: hypothetical protein RML32_05170, partial [Gammaproteobacteria bacterium]|nr:hypothetical protein [Gammaproteobacteria bacterium]
APLGRRVELEALVRAGRLDYRQPQFELLDITRYLAGVALTRHGIGARSGRLGAALLAGHDAERRRFSPYGNDKLGARVFGSLALRPRVLLHAELLYLKTHYHDGRFLGIERDDELLLALGGVEFAGWPGRGWTIAPQLRFTDNDSTVRLFAYDRFEAMLFVRRAFD